MYDVVIIGSGPAGISASLYTVRGNLDTLIIGGDSWLSKAHKIENYYGFPDGIDGNKLFIAGQEQAINLGAKIIDAKVLSIGYEDNSYKVVTENEEFLTKAILIATGQVRNRVNIKNIDNFEGKGIHYCVVCDGFFYRDKKLGLLGYTDYAIHEAVELLNFSKDVTLYTNGKELELNETSKKLLEENKFIMNTKPIREFSGENNLEKIILNDESVDEIEGMFVAYGTASSNDFARKLGIIIKNNIIDVDKDQKTNIPGIFAAGDCTSEFRQIAVAVGQGSIAGQKIVEYIRGLSKE